MRISVMGVSEKSLYPAVCQWLEKWLARRYDSISTFDTSARKLSIALLDNRWENVL